MTGAKVTGLSELSADLRKAAETVVEQAKKVVGAGCNNIKKDAKKRVAGYAHLPHYPRSIDYDVTAAGTTVTGEVGRTGRSCRVASAGSSSWGPRTTRPSPISALLSTPNCQRSSGMRLSWVTT
jgi:hypothetical protein